MTQRLKQILSDIRILWVSVPLLGNLIFLPALIFGLLTLRAQKPDPVLRGFAGACLVFFFWYVAVGLWALPDPGLPSAISRILPFLFFGLVFVWSAPQPKTDFPLQVFIWVAVVVFILVVGERLTWGHPKYRTELLTGNTQFLGPAVLPFVYLNWWAAWRSNGAQRWLHLGASFLTLFVIGSFGGNRAGLLTVFCLLVLHLGFVVVLYRGPITRKLVHSLFVVSTTIATYVYSTLLGSTSEKFKQVTQWASGQSEDIGPSGNLRFEMWRASWEAMQGHMLIGHGPQNRFEAIRPFLPPEFASLDLSNPHNLIFTLGLGGGVIGIALGLFMICSVVFFAFFTAWRRRPEFELLMMGAAAIGAYGMSNLVLFEGYMAIVTIFMLVGPLYLMARR